MKNYQPVSIRDIGLKQFLEDTREKHNNKGYMDFKELLENGIFKTQIAKIFGVRNQTIWYWMKYYNE